MEENTADWCGLDKSEYTNAVSAKDVKVGQEVSVFDLNSYRNPPKTPLQAIITKIYDFYIVVEIGVEEWEVYEGGFGYKL